MVGGSPVVAGRVRASNEVSAAVRDESGGSPDTFQSLHPTGPTARLGEVGNSHEFDARNLSTEELTSVSIRSGFCLAHRERLRLLGAIDRSVMDALASAVIVARD